MERSLFTSPLRGASDPHTDEGTAVQLPEATGQLPLRTPDDREVALESLWAERPVVLTLVRHFGCIFCREQVAQMRRIAPEIRAAGADLVFVGNGTPQMAEAFVEDFGIDVPVYTDPTREVYGALGAQRPGRGAMLRPRMWRYTLRAVLSGSRQARKVQGDRAQVGGVFIVQPGGDLAWAYRSRLAGDHPSNERVLLALRAAMDEADS